MLFLKKIIANGFKSFATKVEIDFKHQMTGVVGPNGSGKSNIVDAIKWVLGEKSNKTLRGKTSEDVIFHGSVEHQPAKCAEITLVFDNSNHVLHHDENEITITRRLTRGEGNNEYFLNNEPCRLKDIQDIFLDTGLSKGSLGIISQGTVQWFVDAKPEDRRTIFEDAAGIGLYLKKRDEAVKSLEKTDENLNRINDITNELKNQLNKLRKQADKAKIYEEKMVQLKQLDLTMMVKDLKYFSEKLKTINKDAANAKDKLSVFEPNIKELNQSIQFSRQKEEQAEKNIEVLTKEFNELVENINKLEIKKSSLNSQLQADLTSDNLNKKIEALESLISSTKFTIEDAKKNTDKLSDSVNTYEEIIKDLTKKRDNLSSQANDQSNKLVEIRTKIKHLVDQINSQNSTSIGVRTILENKKALTGICGLVNDFIEIDDKYQIAMDVALGKSSSNIVVKKDVDAENAIDFLKQNRAGKATFLPLQSIRPKGLKSEHLDVLTNRQGYIGIASELVKYKEEYENIYRFLLGNVIIADNLNDAFNLSRLTYQLYRVITLDGELISPGGAVTGGYINKANFEQVANPQKILDELNKQYPQINDELINTKLELEKIIADLNDISSKQSERKILLSRYEESFHTNENQLIKYEADYNQLLKANNIESKIAHLDQNTIDEQLAKLVARRNKINEDLTINRNNKAIYKSQLIDQEAKINEIRFQLDAARDVVSKHEVEKVKCESILENAKTKINEDYKMTLEFAMENYNQELPISDYEARQTIDQLREDIARLGPINMEALNELNQNQGRYETLVKQQEELQKAHDDMSEVIRKLDTKAQKEFSNTIDKVNEMLPNVFKYLFGGGTCRVEYVDPEHVLTSGLDVTAAPFGKNVAHLSLLSGGEKSLVALSILFTILNIKNFPLVILDEAESALDPANVERFANIIQQNCENTQFIVITHRPGTMEKCDILYGATMQNKGVTSIYQVELEQAQNDFGSDEQTN